MGDTWASCLPERWAHTQCSHSVLTLASVFSQELDREEERLALLMLLDPEFMSWGACSSSWEGWSTCAERTREAWPCASWEGSCPCLTSARTFAKQRWQSQQRGESSSGLRSEQAAQRDPPTEGVETIPREVGVGGQTF